MSTSSELCFQHHKVHDVRGSIYREYLVQSSPWYRNQKLPTRPYLVRDTVEHYKISVLLEVRNFRQVHISLTHIYKSLILHSFMNKIWNIDISQYKGYFSSKSVLGTEIKNFRRYHFWLTHVLNLHSFMNKIWNIDISKYKGYLVAS